MTKPRISLQDLRRRIYAKAKSDTSWRFWGLYGHVCKEETLHEAYRLAKKNAGAPGTDGVSFAAIEAGGVDVFLAQTRDELVSRKHVPMVNEEKSRTVDLAKGESFGFLGFDIRRVRSARGKWYALATPKQKKRTELLGRLREVFASHRSQPVAHVIARINPMLRGWVNYFAYGHSSVCFSFVRDWVDKKVRRHLARNSKRSGFGWKRWSRRWLTTHLGLFADYRVSYGPRQKALPVR